MTNKIFGEMSFDFGWKTKTEIALWGKTYAIIVDAEAYKEEDEITGEQEGSYASFQKMKTEKQNTIESLLSQYFKDHENDEDNGIAVILSPEEEVVTQDEYL